ncbi:hypothetical protein ACRAWG_12780 [Methylobacterium sp. P31]
MSQVRLDGVPRLLHRDELLGIREQSVPLSIAGKARGKTVDDED